jgi:NADPH:quinone reductase-like Zn-dependent oxidoreductase
MDQQEITTMRSLVSEAYGPPAGYTVLSLPIPKIGAPDELLIKVHAASINPIDVGAANGAMKMAIASTYVLH